MDKDFIYILQVFSRNDWRDKFQDKDLTKLSEMAESLSRITLERYRIIRIDFETISLYGNND